MGKQQKISYDKKANIDIFTLYRNFKDEFHKKHEALIKEYLTHIRGKKIGIDKWGVHDDCVLFIYCKGEGREPRIGIECVFEGTSYKHPLGLFHIYVATWGRFNIDEYYEKELKKAFPDRDIDEDKGAKNRAFLLVKVLAPDDKDIIPTLEKTYKTLNRIIKNHEQSIGQ